LDSNEFLSKSRWIVAPRESAVVFALKEMGTITGARLKEGEDKRFKHIGLQLGTELPAKKEHQTHEIIRHEVMVASVAGENAKHRMTAGRRCCFQGCAIARES
jgi:hypothetical protein